VLALGAAGAGVTALGWPRAARAVLRLDITQGTVQPMPIALPDFVGGSGGDSDVAHRVTGIITNNLKRSGLFAPIDPAVTRLRNACL
jgi:TolB protein